jgi:hypothetical protein
MECIDTVHEVNAVSLLQRFRVVLTVATKTDAKSVTSSLHCKLKVLILWTSLYETLPSTSVVPPEALRIAASATWAVRSLYSTTVANLDRHVVLLKWPNVYMPA